MTNSSFPFTQNQYNPTFHSSTTTPRGKVKTRIRRRPYSLMTGGVTCLLYTLFLYTLLVTLLSGNSVSAKDLNQSGSKNVEVIDKRGEIPCATYPPKVKEIVLEEMRRQDAIKAGKPAPEYKEKKECFNICDLCKTKEIVEKVPEKVIVPEKKRICLGDPPIVPLYLPYETTSVTTSVYLEMPTDSKLYKLLPPGADKSEILNFVPHDVPDHASLQNKILHGDFPSDVNAKLLALHLYDQDKAVLNKAINNLSRESPFKSEEPPKPVGHSTTVALMLFVNYYFECNDNPTDLRDLKY